MDTEQKPEVPKFDWAKPKDVPEIYCNILHVSWTLYDVRFQIGQLMPVGPEPSAKFVAEERGGVTIAWPGVKSLRDTLIDLVAKYEKVNGEIKPINLAPNKL